MVKEYLADDCNSTKAQFSDLVWELHKELQQIRSKLQSEVEKTAGELGEAFDKIGDRCSKMEAVMKKSNDMMTGFAKAVVRKSASCLKRSAPCGFCVVGIGSLARAEATPFSDVEYLFLVDDIAFEKYFEQLAVMMYFCIGALGETKLSSIDVKELEGWYLDDRVVGFQIDGITKSSGNVPTRNSLKPNEFISTPADLLEIYKETLQTPTKESLRGDMTSMLRFTCLIHSEGNGDQLHKTFVEKRIDLDKDMSKDRQQSNLKMLCNDLEKYEFSPDYDDYTNGFTMDIKTSLYRLPSLLLLDLAIVLGLFEKSSSQTLNKLGERGISFSNHLRVLLAFACFSRLRCYLSMGRKVHEFQVLEDHCIDHVDRGSEPLPIGVGNQGKDLVFEQDSKLWAVTSREFYVLCESLLSVHGHFPEKVNSVQQVANIIEMDVVLEDHHKVLAHFFTCRWASVAETASSMDSEPFLVALSLARSLLQLKRYKASLGLYNNLLAGRDDQRKKDIADIYRGMARCHEAMGSLNEASQSYSAAISALSDSDKRVNLSKARALLELEQVNLHRRLDGVASKQQLKTLFKILKDLLLINATSPKSTKDDIQILIKMFDEKGYQGILKFVNDPSRELAHCLFSVAEILRQEDRRLAKKYLAKSYAFDLRMVIDQQTDGLTKVSILQSLGRKTQTLRYFSKARQLLQNNFDTNDTQVAQIEADILLSQGECYSETRDDKDVEAAEQDEELETQLDMIVGSSFQDDTSDLLHTNPQKFIQVTTETVKRTTSDKNHVNYGVLMKIEGKIAAKGGNPEKAHKCFEKASDIFSENNCKTEVVVVREADGDVYKGEDKKEKAEESYRKVEAGLKEVYGEKKSSSAAYMNVLSKRGEMLGSLGETDKSEELKKEAANIKENREKVKQQLQADIERNKQKG